MNLNDFDPKDYGTLLAANVLDASNTLLDAVGLEPDNHYRTILVGVGGTGVRTIDYVKGAISKRLDPKWKDYIAFLAVDASWTEIDHKRYLDEAECIEITVLGVDKRMEHPASYPGAVRRFMPDNIVLSGLNSDGCGRTRLAGKIKIHDQAPGAPGVDEQIVKRLHDLSNTDAAVDGCQVYVIGSACGGTCSGSFLEFPALIRQAIPNAKINAMLYLPDTLQELDPLNAQQMKANGYATLKELNYFMGLPMRPNNGEIWTYNSDAIPELKIAGGQKFIDVCHLIGTTNGPVPDSNKIAQETIAEFLINLLTHITTPEDTPFAEDALESNVTAEAHTGTKFTMPGAKHMEADGAYHEFPQMYSAIGFAEASVPQKLVKAYAVGKVCTAAGLKPVEPNVRAAMAAAPHAVLPFAGVDPSMNATEGTDKAKEILQPLNELLSVIHNGSFEYQNVMHEPDLKWEDIKNGTYKDSAHVLKATTFINNATNSDQMRILKNWIKEAFTTYRKNVKEFVREFGPFAFANLYFGNFTAVGENHGVGISKMLQNLEDGRNMDGTPFAKWKTKQAADDELLDFHKNVIAPGKHGLLGAVGIDGPKKKNQIQTALTLFSATVNAEINQKRRETALFDTGALRESFIVPAAKLTDDLRSFGYILSDISDIYNKFGESMSNFEKFSEATDKETEVNLAAVHVSSFNWLKSQSDAKIAAVHAIEFRNALVDHFFDLDSVDKSPNSIKWLEIPNNVVKKATDGNWHLTNPEVSVPARRIFDQFVAKSPLMKLDVDVSIREMFVQLEAAGEPYNKTAQKILKELKSKSRPQFNAEIPEKSTYTFILYPASLTTDAGKGAAIAEAIKEEASKIFKSVQVYATDAADSIMVYQQAAPLNIYTLKELPNWAAEYEQGTYGIGSPTTRLHGKSPDVIAKIVTGQPTVYEENTKWIDYPPIIGSPVDPRTPDPLTGVISREGNLLLKLDKLIQRAKRCGVLYCEQRNGNEYMVRRVYCDMAVDWRFDLMDCEPDALGMLPRGKELAKTVAMQNGKTLEQISADVMLNLAGVFSVPAPTEEIAWQHAARVLRAHVPMMIEVRKTTEKFEPWAAQIDEFNKSLIEQLKPAKMLEIIRAGLLVKEDDTWKLKLKDGRYQNIVVLSDKMVRHMQPKPKFMVEHGLVAYYLFDRLQAKLPALHEDFDSLYERAIRVHDNMLEDEEKEEELTTFDNLAAALLEEAEKLRANGAHLDGDAEAEPRKAFKEAYGKIGEDKLKEVDVFYYRLQCELEEL